MGAWRGPHEGWSVVVGWVHWMCRCVVAAFAGRVSWVSLMSPAQTHDGKQRAAWARASREVLLLVMVKPLGQSKGKRKADDDNI